MVTVIIGILSFVVLYGSMKFLSLWRDYSDLRRRERIWRNSYYDLSRVWPYDQNLRRSITNIALNAIKRHEQLTSSVRDSGSPGGAVDLQSTDINDLNKNIQQSDQDKKQSHGSERSL